MQNKFKVGDRVLIIQGNLNRIGKKGTIIKIHGEGVTYRYVTNLWGKYPFRATELRLINECSYAKYI